MVATGILLRQMWRQNAEKIVGPGRCAVVQQQPGCLQVTQLWDVILEAVMLNPFKPKSTLDVGLMPQGRAQDVQPLLVGGEGPMPPTQTGSCGSHSRSEMFGGSSPAAFQILVLPACNCMRACSHKAA